MSGIGTVVIGRNEGERLRRCLASLGASARVVYVDSGSTDGSVELARAMGVEVVELDASSPFSAARGRNAGFERLRAIDPEIEAVQFVDGDCEIAAGWLETAAATLRARPDAAMVCGRLRERYPERSIYNRLCDLEWNALAGEVRACGGIAMARAAAFEQVGGYDPAIIAGEEPEMCLRLRQRGWTIHRLDAEMGWHDAAMTRFGQWWKRAKRGGYAFAEGMSLHGRTAERYRVRESAAIWFWAGLLPLTILALAAIAAAGWGGSAVTPMATAVAAGCAAGLLALYPIQWWRIARARQRDGLPTADARLYALFTLLGKFPQLAGQLRFWLGRALGRRSGVIEYKGSC